MVRLKESFKTSSSIRSKWKCNFRLRWKEISYPRKRRSHQVVGFSFNRPILKNMKTTGLIWCSALRQLDAPLLPIVISVMRTTNGITGASTITALKSQSSSSTYEEKTIANRTTGADEIKLLSET